MDPQELRQMFDALAPTAEQEEAGLSRLLQTERKIVPMKKLRKLTAVGIAAALLVITCAAAVVLGIDQRLADYFGAGPEQAKLLAPGAVTVDVTVEDNDSTLHVNQVLMDRYYIMLLADFTAPEGTVLDRNDYTFDAPVGIVPELLDRDGAPLGLESGWAYQTEVLSDGAPQDNHLSVLLRIELSEGIQPDWDIGGISLYNGDLVRYGAEPWEKITVCSGNWSCKVPFTWQDMGRSIQPGQAVGELDGIGITLTELYLSPMTLRFRLESESPISGKLGGGMVRRWSQLIDSDHVTLTTRNGETIPLIGNGGEVSGQDQVCFFRLSEITALEELQGGTLTLHIGEESCQIPLTGLTGAE